MNPNTSLEDVMEAILRPSGSSHKAKNPVPQEGLVPSVLNHSRIAHLPRESKYKDVKKNPSLNSGGIISSLPPGWLGFSDAKPRSISPAQQISYSYEQLSFEEKAEFDKQLREFTFFCSEELVNSFENMSQRLEQLDWNQYELQAHLEGLIQLNAEDISRKNNQTNFPGLAVDLIRIYSMKITGYLFLPPLNRKRRNGAIPPFLGRPLKLDSGRGRLQLADDDFYSAKSVLHRLIVLNTSDARDSVTESGLFSQLASALQTCLSHANTPISDVTEGILAQVPKERDINLDSTWEPTLPLYSITLMARWDLLLFLQSRFGTNIPSLASMAVITGSVNSAYATTCARYFESMWGDSGRFFLDAMQDLVSHFNKSPGESTCNILAADKDLGLSLDISKYDSKYVSPIQIVVHGRSRASLLAISQQAAWMSAVFHATHHKRVVQANFRAVSRDMWDEGFNIIPGYYDFYIRDETLYSPDTSCWFPLFGSASMAGGFPIPRRGDELGLEISLDMMAAAAGARHAVEFEGGLVIKGFSCMCVPVKIVEDRIQWHLIRSENPETRLNYRDVLQRCPDRLLLDKFDLRALRTTRAFLGWCSEVSSTLGSTTADYEQIDYSGAKDVSRSLRISGASLGLQQIGLAQCDFTFGQNMGMFHFQRSGSFQRILSAAEKTPVLLYDSLDKRAWLVPADEVLLHIAQHRNFREHFQFKGERVHFEGPNSSMSVRDALLKNGPISLSDERTYTFMDLIINTWSILEFLADQMGQTSRQSGVPVNPTIKTAIQGFEFLAIAEERSPMKMKKVKLETSSGEWSTLIRDIDALVLFAKGFKDILQPVPDGNPGLCCQLMSMPAGKDYLGTTTKMLEDLYYTAGCRWNRKYLTSTRLQWHQGTSSLFNKCESPGESQCECNRVQQIVSKRTLATIIPPKDLAQNGAVIFGQSGSWLDSFKRLMVSPKNADSGQLCNLSDSGHLSSRSTISQQVSLPSVASEKDQLASDGSCEDNLAPRLPEQPAQNISVSL